MLRPGVAKKFFVGGGALQDDFSYYLGLGPCRAPDKRGWRALQGTNKGAFEFTAL